MDFSAILSIATLASGLVWGIDTCFFKSKRLASSQETVKEPKLVEYARSFFPILLIVLILRAFIAEPFRIPSGSMKPTLLEGDFILVNKFTYGLRLPISGHKILQMGEPKRGDILVFRYPKDTSVDFIKRVIGLPGDKISYENKKIILNGKPLSQEYVGTQTDVDVSGQSRQVKRYNEQIDALTHAIFLDSWEGKTLKEIEVPKGMYFVMGDNRDNSEDSRVWGFVPEDLILGKAFFIWLSWDSHAKDLRWQRMGHKI